MMKLNQLSTFNKASIMLITGISLASLTIPYAKAETKVRDVAAESPIDADFKQLDVNSDKKISLKEAVKDKALATGFDVTDLNKDGNITPDEYASFKGSTVKPLDSSASSVMPPTTP
jgi:hypothetical protein